MENRKTINVLVMETDTAITEKIEKLLKERSYQPTRVSTKDDATSLLKRGHYPLALVGHTFESDSVFESMKDIVMTSPMTSMLLITDRPQAEVDEKSEGYGILGHVKRNIPAEDLTSLLNNFEGIYKTLPGKK